MKLVTARATLVGTLVGITDQHRVAAVGVRLQVKSRSGPARTDSQTRAIGPNQFNHRSEAGAPANLRDLKSDPVAFVRRNGPHVQRISKVNRALVNYAIGQRSALITGRNGEGTGYLRQLQSVSARASAIGIADRHGIRAADIRLDVQTCGHTTGFDPQ